MSELNNEPSKVTHNFNTVVVGVHFYQKELIKLVDGRIDEKSYLATYADIIPDDENQHDPFAVRVEIKGEIVGYLKNDTAKLWRSKMMIEKISTGSKCRAIIKWDRNFEKEGSYSVWLDIDFSQLDSKPENEGENNIIINKDRPDHIQFLVNRLNRFELSNCKVGDEVNLWIADQNREIIIYRLGCAFGEGKLGVCPDKLFKTISDAPGYEAFIVSIYEGGCKIDCRVFSKSEMNEINKEIEADEKKRRDEILAEINTPFEYSVIDEDIYKCFISNKSGMCERLGSWEQFNIVEERIIDICMKNKGRYYKSPTKNAKFAIIFSPSSRNYSNVTKLKEKGYKVTSFENVLVYFRLTDMWDCKKFTDAEEDYRRSALAYV